MSWKKRSIHDNTVFSNPGLRSNLFPSVDIQQECGLFSCCHSTGAGVHKTDVLQGTLDLMVLKTLDTLGSMHGYGIAQRIQQVSSQMLQLNQGTLYPALLRLEQKGWIAAKWGMSDNNRRAKYYSLTKLGRKQLAREEEDWMRLVEVIGRVLKPEGTQS
jgi:PadR family transcriptional regulator PadR